MEIEFHFRLLAQTATTLRLGLASSETQSERAHDWSGPKGEERRQPLLPGGKVHTRINHYSQGFGNVRPTLDVALQEGGASMGRVSQYATEQAEAERSELDFQLSQWRQMWRESATLIEELMAEQRKMRDRLEKLEAAYLEEKYGRG